MCRPRAVLLSYFEASWADRMLLGWVVAINLTQAIWATPRGPRWNVRVGVRGGSDSTIPAYSLAGALFGLPTRPLDNSVVNRSRSIS